MAGYLSDDTTVFSNVSLTGNLAATNLSATTLTGSFSTLTVANSIKVGGGTAITKSAGTQIAVVAMVCPNATSTTTTATWSGLSTADVVTVNTAASGLSTGLMVQAYCNAADTVTLRFLNGSASTVTQAAANYRFVAWRF